MKKLNNFLTIGFFLKGEFFIFYTLFKEIQEKNKCEVISTKSILANPFVIS